MRICLVRIDKMGDMILTLPIIQGLNQSDNSNYEKDCKINKDFVLLFEKRERSILNIPGLKVKI